MINITNYKEMIRTSNDDGTEKVEIIGCKMTDNGEEIEVNLIIPRLLSSEDRLTALTDNNGDKMLFTLYVPE